MKYIKTYESLLDDGASRSSIDHEKVFQLTKRKVKKVKDYIFKSNRIKSDKEIINEKQLIKNIHLAIKNFGKFYSFFGGYRYRKVHGSFTDFLWSYEDIIDDFGYYPNNITKELLSYLSTAFFNLQHIYGAYLSQYEKSSTLFDKQR